jgi:hypothetical protein
MLIGGDDSVVWSHTHGTNDLPVTRVGKGKLHEPPNTQRNAVNVRNEEGWVEGRDPMDTRGRYFKISIKLGAEAEDFARRLAAAAEGALANPQPNGRVTFTLLIEDHTPNQIYVNWAFSKDETTVTSGEVTPAAQQ